MSRRRFLTGLGVATAAAVAAGYGLTVWQSDGSSGDRDAAAPRPTPPSARRGRADRTLVVVELGGGNDGLSTVVPIGRPRVPRAAPDARRSRDPIALDDTVGLHPKLAKLAARYQAGQVAIVEGVGYPDPNLSHFASLAYWWTGTPGAGDGSGWIGRYLDGTVGFDDPLAAISIGPVPSPALLGDQLVRDVDRRHDRAPALGARVGRHARTTSSPRGAGSRRPRRIRRRCSGRSRRRSTSR